MSTKFPVIRGIGQITSPLAIARVRGETKLMVSPWAAIGTDVMGLSASTALFLSTRNSYLKALAAVTGGWMIAAAAKETQKLIEGPEMIVNDTVQYLSECVGCGKRMSLAPGMGEILGVKCLYCLRNFCCRCGDDHFNQGGCWRGVGVEGTMVSRR